MIDTVARHLDRDDIIIDGGNTNFHDDMRRAEALKQLGLHYMDVGTSGGIWGLQVGYCLMIGGDEAVFRHLEPLFRTLAPENGYGHMGAHGAGHYVKMVHNGIEYGMMQAIAEGFALMHKSPYGLELPKIADLWMQGSVVRSWLVELAGRGSRKDPRSRRSAGGWRTGEGRDRAGRDRSGRARLDDHGRALHPVPLPRGGFLRRQDARRLRNQFGGHAVKARE